jgi:hypothetical protein
LIQINGKAVARLCRTAIATLLDLWTCAAARAKRTLRTTWPRKS